MKDTRTPGEVFVDTVEHWSFKAAAECGGGSFVVALLIEIYRCVEACDQALDTPR